MQVVVDVDDRVRGGLAVDRDLPGGEGPGRLAVEHERRLLRAAEGRQQVEPAVLVEIGRRELVDALRRRDRADVGHRAGAVVQEDGDAGHLVDGADGDVEEAVAVEIGGEHLRPELVADRDRGGREEAGAVVLEERQALHAVAARHDDDVGEAVAVEVADQGAGLGADALQVLHRRELSRRRRRGGRSGRPCRRPPRSCLPSPFTSAAASE
jgi:hypothetical protein